MGSAAEEYISTVNRLPTAPATGASRPLLPRAILAWACAIGLSLPAGLVAALGEGSAPSAGEAVAADAAIDSPLAVELSGAPEACAWQGDEAGVLLPVVLTLGPAESADPDGIRPALDCAREKHLAVVLRIEPPTDWQEAPDPYEALGPWLGTLEQLLQASRGRISAVILGRRPDLAFSPASYAFLLEKIGTLIRSLDSEASLVVGDLTEGSRDWLDRLPAARIEPYAGGILVSDLRSLGALIPRLAAGLPGLPVWVEGSRDADAGALVHEFHAARSLGAVMYLAEASAGPRGRVLAALVRRLPLRFVPDPDPQVVAIHDRAGGGPEEFFADPLGPERAAVLPPAPAGKRQRVSIGPDPIQTLRSFDLGTGEELPVKLVGGGSGIAPLVLDVAGTGAPILLRYVAQTAPRAEPETVSVVSGYELSAEEIIARLRAFEAAERRHLSNYTARATLSYHYRAESLNESISVTSVNRFYWRDGVGDYEELELFVNGARWRGEPPSLPFIQAEKVKEVPIEIRLDASYVYRREGKDTVNGRPSYVLSFHPEEEDSPLYSGQAWIDEKTFALNKIRLVQPKPKAPITSSSDVLEYGWVEGRERRHWLPIRGYRQMVFTALGRAVAVEREADYEDFSVNADTFDTSLAQAYESKRPILRDDAEGISYMRRDGDGGRVKAGFSQRNVALVGGMNIDTSIDLGTPFAGINYFDFDFRGTGTQVDVAFAGPFINAAWTNPSLGDSRWELSLETVAIGVRQKFRRSTSDGRLKVQELASLEERASVELARPLTPFSKAELQLDLEYEDYDGTDRTAGDFVRPSSGWTATTTGRYRYYRGGFLADLWASASQRYGWEDWGFPGGVPGSTGSASEDSFQRWGLNVAKSLYAGPNHKFSFSAGVSAGRDLDRFSRFRIGDFRNAKVHGYNGLDITFERGVATQASYLLTMPRTGISLEFSVDGAVVENHEDFGVDRVRGPTGGYLLVERPGANDREYLTGASLAVSFGGPWGTLMRVSAGEKLGSSIETGSHPISLRFTIVKTYPDWPWGRKKRARKPEAASP